jgi:hypothetical protein
MEVTMNDLARQKLHELISNYGAAVCSTPGTVKMLLGQQCLDFPAEKELFLRALDKGAVAGVMRAPVGGPWDDLVNQVAGSSVSTEDARWAVESWAMALGKHPDAAPLAPEPVIDMHKPPPATKTDSARAKGSVMVVGMGGAIGGAIPGFVFLLLAVAALGVKLTRHGVDSPPGAGILIILIGVVIGSLCGGSGAAVGWWIVQMQSSFVNYTTEEWNRRLRKGFIGALVGPMIGSGLGCGVGIRFFNRFGPLGIPAYIFFGAMCGAISGGYAGAAGGTSRTY